MSPLPINSELARRLVFVEKHPNWWKSLYIPAPFISSIIDSYNLNLISDRSGTIILASLATTPSKLNSIYVSIRWSHGNVPSILIQHMCAFEHILINSLLTPSARENTKSPRKRAFIQITSSLFFSSPPHSSNCLPIAPFCCLIGQVANAASTPIWNFIVCMRRLDKRQRTT